MDIIPINDDLNGLARELGAFMKPEAEAARVEIVEDLDASLPALPFDRRYVKQALLNLMSNSIAAMPGGGTLTLRTGRNEEAALVSVADTGTGIDDAHLGKIFEPYFTTKDTGTGLGLTITYKIAREHGGDVAVKSRKGYGSTFTISLPIPQKEQRLLTENGEQRIVREADD